jgi:hypothetical protein
MLGDMAMAQHGYLREFDEGWDRGDDRDSWREEDRERGFMLSDRGHDWRRDRSGDAPRSFSAHPDDHYRSWRDKQIRALDREYEEYCREREQQFHQDFDKWRSQRSGNNPGPLRTGMTQTGQSHDPSGTLELTNEATDNADPKADPIDSATLGTN